jgi:phosphoglucosamine mutase
VISASHNPFEDNGIKVFSGAGEKFTEALEQRVEAEMVSAAVVADAAATDSGAALELLDYRHEYIEHLKEILGAASATSTGSAAPVNQNAAGTSAVRGMRIAIDCANGATTTVAPRLFQELGFDAQRIGCEPDGRNINLRCGSTHPEALARMVVEGGYRLGIAFDGDGDRAIFVDGAGKVVDGDAVMLMCARRLKAEGRLKGDAIVATVMSNIGLEIALRQSNIGIVRCPVGDKYVMEEMLRRNLSLGGEQSGHIIFSDYLFTGDGLATALNVLKTMVQSGRELADLAAEFTAFPQVLVNVRVARKVDLATLPDVSALIESVESRLTGQGRLLVRYSGTEPLLRVMLEGRDRDEITRWANEIGDAVKKHAGAPA